VLTTEQQQVLYHNIMAYPQHWPEWPFLPLVRGDNKDVKEEEKYEVGILFDVFHLCQHTWKYAGYSATVFKENKHWLPIKVVDVLALPKESFDTLGEVLAAGWRPDIEPLQGVLPWNETPRLT
jgi:hypothetical protein